MPCADAGRLGDLDDRRVVVAELARRPAPPPRAAAHASRAAGRERAAVGAGDDVRHAATSAQPRELVLQHLVHRLRGSSSTKRTALGTLKRASRARQCSISSSSPRRRRRTTNATPPSPQRSSGTPTTAASATAGCSCEHRLDLGRVDVLAAGDVHVLEAAADAVEALLVALGDVARAEPAVVGERAARRLLVAPVAGENVRAAHLELAVGREAARRRVDTACPRSPPCAPRPRAGGRARSAPPRSGRSPARSSTPRALPGLEQRHRHRRAADDCAREGSRGRRSRSRAPPP